MENKLFNLSDHRSVLSITGTDKETFLQGLISNDIYKCSESNAIYACLLSPQGKFLYEMFIIQQNERLLVDCESETADDLIKRLKMYKLRSDVQIEKTDYKVFAAFNTDIPTIKAFDDPRHEAMGKRLLTDTSTPAIDELDIYDIHRLKLGIPNGLQDLIQDKAILLENGIDELNGIDWNKGCYVGQELTARTKHRGLVRKRLLPVTFEGNAPECGTILYADDKKAGEMRSSNGTQGLALIRLAFLDQNISTEKGEECSVQIPDWIELPDIEKDKA